jgi:hypothetical protein
LYSFIKYFVIKVILINISLQWIFILILCDTMAVVQFLYTCICTREKKRASEWVRGRGSDSVNICDRGDLLRKKPKPVLLSENNNRVLCICSGGWVWYAEAEVASGNRQNHNSFIFLFYVIYIYIFVCVFVNLFVCILGWTDSFI